MENPVVNKPNQLIAEKDNSDFVDLTCDQAINKLIAELPKKTSIFYFILNGAYLG